MKNSSNCPRLWKGMLCPCPSIVCNLAARSAAAVAVAANGEPKLEGEKFGEKMKKE